MESLLVGLLAASTVAMVVLVGEAGSLLAGLSGRVPRLKPNSDTAPLDGVSQQRHLRSELEFE